MLTFVSLRQRCGKLSELTRIRSLASPSLPMPRLLDIPELVDRIIDHLHNDTKTLRSTALVARNWRASSQLHLLSRVEVVDTERLAELCEKLPQQPRLASYILRLKMKNLRLDVKYEVHAFVQTCILAVKLQDLELEWFRCDQEGFISPLDVPTTLQRLFPRNYT